MKDNRFIIYDEVGHDKLFGIDVKTIKDGDLFRLTYSNDEREVFKTKYTVPILIACVATDDSYGVLKKHCEILTPCSAFQSTSYIDSIKYPSVYRHDGRLHDLKLNRIGQVSQSISYHTPYPYPYDKFKVVKMNSSDVWKKWKKSLIDSGSYIPLEIAKTTCEAKDFLGETLEVGDEVIFTGCDETRLMKGNVTSISDSGMSVRIDNSYTRLNQYVYKIKK